MVELTYSPNLPIHINDTEVNKSTPKDYNNTNTYKSTQIIPGSKIVDKKDCLSENWTKKTGLRSNALVDRNNMYNKASSHDYEEITELFPKRSSSASYKRTSIDSNGRTVDNEDRFIDTCKIHLSDPYFDDSASEDNFLMARDEKNKRDQIEKSWFQKLKAWFPCFNRRKWLKTKR